MSNKPSKCTSCGRKYVYERRKGGTKTRCSSCLVNDRRFKLKKKIVSFLGGKCSKCGYKECLGALEAHHVKSDLKDFAISGAHSKSWESIEKELKKCILLCSNCHRKLHHNCERFECKK